MNDDIVRILAAAAGPRRPPVSMTTVRVAQASPLILDDGGTALDGGVRRLASYTPLEGDLALMVRAGGLAVLIGKVI